MHNSCVHHLEKPCDSLGKLACDASIPFNCFYLSFRQGYMSSIPTLQTVSDLSETMNSEFVSIKKHI